MHHSTYISFLAALLSLAFVQCSSDSAEQISATATAPAIEEKTTKEVVPATVQTEVSTPSESPKKEITKAKVPKEKVEKTETVVEKEPVKAKQSTEPQKKPATVKKKRAKMKFSQTTHKFGTIKTGDKVKHQFKFKNLGDAPLVIKNVDVSCGCTFPSYPFLPIKPGESGEIEVTFDSKNKVGRQKPTITVVTNGRPRTTKLYLEGFVE